MPTEQQPSADNSFHDFIDSLPEPPKPPKPQPKKKSRAPIAHGHGIDINFCKNPNCANFGVPIEQESRRGPGAANRYTVVADGKNHPSGRCNTCGESFPLKSNDGVFEEAWRICAETFPEPSCPNQGCSNHRVGVSAEGAYFSLGKTKAGSQRYRCRQPECGRIFSSKPRGLDPTARHRQPEKNELLFELLVNKMPLRRICDVAKVAPRVLYERIDFFHEQALAFLAHHESRLPNLPIRRLYIGVDRQEYSVNWSQREDKRNVILSAVAAADNGTGYVFGMHTNFDPDVSPRLVEEHNFSTNDHMLPAAHRRFARLWVNADYEAAVAESRRRKPAGSLAGEIANEYESAAGRGDIESPEFMDHMKTLPDSGMLVHAEYTLYGAFIRMKNLFRNVEKVRFFLDQDSGLRAACLASFHDRIKDRTADAMYVRISKDQTIDEKQKLVAAARKNFRHVASMLPTADENEVRLVLLKKEIRAARSIGQWKDRWVMHPLPTISETEKASCFLTDLGDYDDDHQAWLHNKASLHAVDSWFNRVRRRNSMLERPVKSASNMGRTYYAYSAYRPEQIAKLLTILRVCHNYIWTPADRPKSEKKETPAMKLGLATAPMTYEDVIAFRG